MLDAFYCNKKKLKRKRREGRKRTEEPGEATRKQRQLKSALQRAVSSWDACTANSHG